MRFTQVLLRRKKGQLHTPKNYQNPNSQQGILTHTRNVELVPKLPKPRGHQYSLHRGAVRRVIQIPTPNDVRKQMGIQLAYEITREHLSKGPYLNEEQEKAFFAVINERVTANELDSISPLKLEILKKEGRTMEEIVWKMRRKDGRKQRPGDFITPTSGMHR